MNWGWMVVAVVGCSQPDGFPCDGVLTPGELCDDGNAADGDGCDCAARTIPPPEGNAMTPGTPVVVAEDGAWCWFQDERVILEQDRVVVSSISHGGDIQVSSLEPTSGTRTHAILHTRLERDDHDVASLLALPDGRIAAYYTRHDGFPHLYTRISGGPGELAVWPTRTTTSFDYDVTYTNPFVLDGRPERVLMFMRGIETNPTLVTSRDAGLRWDDGVQLLDSGDRGVDGRVFDHRPYTKFASDGAVIHLFYTDGHPVEYSSNSVYHLVYRGGDLYRSDGTRVATASSNPMLPPDSGTRVYDGRVLPGGQAWTWDAAVGLDGAPVTVFSTFPDPARPFYDHRYRYARWDGVQWQVSTIAYAGTGIYAAEGYYSGGLTIDPDDPRTVYFASNVDPVTGEPATTSVFEIYRGVTPDGGKTWSITPVTTGSRVSNLRPIVPERHVEPTTLVWMRGSYDTYLDYHTQVVMLTGDANAVATTAPGQEAALVPLARFDLAATVNGPATPTAPGFVAVVPAAGYALAESGGISLVVSNITGSREALTRDPLYRGLVFCDRGGYAPEGKLRVELSGLAPGVEYVIRIHGHDTARAYTLPTLWFRGDAATLDSDNNAAFLGAHRNVNNTIAGEGSTDLVLRSDDRGEISLVARGLDSAGDDLDAVLSGLEVLEAPATILAARFDVDVSLGEHTAEGAASVTFDPSTEWSGRAVHPSGLAVRVTSDRIDALRRRDDPDPMIADFAFGRDQLVVDVEGLEVGRLYAFTVYSTDTVHNQYAATRWRLDETGREPIVVHGFHMNLHRRDQGATFTFYHRAATSSFRLRGEDVMSSLSTNPSVVIFNGLDVRTTP